MTDRVIIDSATSSDPRRDMRTIASTLEKHPDWTALSDFNWERLTSWRMLFASFFDVADYRSYLDRIEELNVEYVKREGDLATKALLLVGWLASRLGWTLDAAASHDNGDDNLFVFRAGERTINVRYTPVDRPETMCGWIARATLVAGGDSPATFSVSRSECGSRLTSQVTIGDSVHPSRVLAYRDASEAQLLARELSILTHDRLYEAAVRIAAAMGAVGRP